MKSTKLPSHDIHLKMPQELHHKLLLAAAKLRRTLPDFMRLVLEDAVPPQSTVVLDDLPLPGYKRP